MARIPKHIIDGYSSAGPISRKDSRAISHARLLRGAAKASGPACVQLCVVFRQHHARSFVRLDRRSRAVSPPIQNKNGSLWPGAAGNGSIHPAYPRRPSGTSRQAPGPNGPPVTESFHASFWKNRIWTYPDAQLVHRGPAPRGEGHPQELDRSREGSTMKGRMKERTNIIYPGEIRCRSPRPHDLAQTVCPAVPLVAS